MTEIFRPSHAAWHRYLVAFALSILGAVVIVVCPTEAQAQAGDCPAQRPAVDGALGDEIPASDGAITMRTGFRPRTPVVICVYPDGVKKWEGQADSAGRVRFPIDSSVLPDLSKPLAPAYFIVLSGEDASGRPRNLAQVLGTGSSLPGSGVAPFPDGAAAATPEPTSDRGAIGWDVGSTAPWPWVWAIAGAALVVLVGLIALARRRQKPHRRAS